MADWLEFAFEEEEETTVGQDGTAPGKENFIMLIDARDSMHQARGGGDKPTAFALSLRVSIEILKARIRHSTGDRVAVMLMGTRQAENAEMVEGVYVLCPLEEPSGKHVRTLEAVLEEGASHAALGGSPLATADPLPLADALRVCAYTFAALRRTSGKTQTTDSKRILIFTDDEDPCKGDAAAAARAVQRARDCRQDEQQTALYAFAANDGGFDKAKFWTAAVEEGVDSFEAAEEGGGGQAVTTVTARGDFEDLMAQVRAKMYRKRAYARLPLRIGGAEIGVAVYNTIYPAKKPSASQVHAASGELLVSKTSWRCPITDKLLAPHQIRTVQVVGGGDVPVSRDDISAIKSIGDQQAGAAAAAGGGGAAAAAAGGNGGIGAGLTLLGFKPRSSLHNLHNLRSPYFLYPTEGSLQGSTRAFKALHGSMLRLGRVGIARFLARRGSMPRLVALLAAKEIIEDGAQLQAPGIFAIPLPYADDIRHVVAGDESDPAEPSPAAEEAATKLVRKLKLEEFRAEDFDNPSLTKFWGGLEALAMQEPIPDWDDAKDDSLQPDAAGMQRAAGVIEAFRAECGLGVPGAKPKKAAAASRSAGSKRARAAAPPAGDFDRAFWEGEKAAGRTSKHTVAELKEALKALGLAVGGRKADLVARLEGAL